MWPAGDRQEDFCRQGFVVNSVCCAASFPRRWFPSDHRLLELWRGAPTWVMGWPNTAVAPVVWNSRGRIKRDCALEKWDLEMRLNLGNKAGTLVRHRKNCVELACRWLFQNCGGCENSSSDTYRSSLLLLFIINSSYVLSLQRTLVPQCPHICHLILSSYQVADIYRGGGVPSWGATGLLLKCARRCWKLIKKTHSLPTRHL